MSAFKAVLAVAALALTTILPAQAANLSLPDGTYDCSAYMPMFIYAGDLEVEGNRYRGPSLDKQFSLGWIEFDSDADGNVFLIDKPFGGFTGPGYSVIAAVVTTDQTGAVLLQTSIRSDSTETFTIDCRLKS